MNLGGRVVLITGAARRVGRAIALRLARAGCRIALHHHQSAEDARRTAHDCRAHGAQAESFCADLGDTDAPQRLVREALARFGRLDVLVNNASLFEPSSIDSLDVETWNRALRVNLTAPALLVAAAREALRAARGRVINLCDAATGRPWPSHLAYCVSKGGLDTLTRALARALAPEVNVVGIAPGIVAWPEDYDEALRARLVERVPLKRAGDAEDVAAAVEYVLRDGDYLTGVILPIDGGRHLA